MQHLFLFSLCVVFFAHDASSSIVSCLPSACKSSWTTYGGNLTLECDVASGHLPLGLELPLLFEGNYDLCITFPTSKFCSISSNPMLPLIMPIVNQGKVVGGFPLGVFKLGMCVSQDCDAEGLSEKASNVVEDLVTKMVKLLKLENAVQIETITRSFMDSLKVHCVGDTGAFPAGGLVMIILSVLLVTTVLFATIVSLFFSKSALIKSPVVKWCALNHNFPRLIATIPGDFNVFNGIRFLSMW